MPELPTQLRRGTWLIACVAVWSGTDRAAIQVAADLVHDVPGLQVAVVPFDDVGELRRWAPSLQARYQTPVWLVFRNGELVTERSGAMASEELKYVSALWVGDGGAT